MQIKLGAEIGIGRNGRLNWPKFSYSGTVEFSPHIRPVCLPCSPNSCTRAILTKQDTNGYSLIRGDETEDKICEIERNFLMGNGPNNKAYGIITGFGHNASRKVDEENEWGIRLSVYLNQASLKIQTKQKCKDAVDSINRQIGDPNFRYKLTETMFCAAGEETKEATDACRGDSGGPFVREVFDEATKKSCFVQVGVISWGYGCGQRLNGRPGEEYLPSYFADVASFMPWITSTIENFNKTGKDT